jgi:hypothetical protein
VISWSLGAVAESRVVLRSLVVVTGRSVCFVVQSDAGVLVSYPPYPGDIGTPVVNPAINNSTPNSSTTP